MATNQLQDENFYKRVLQRSQPRLVEDLDPIAVLDLLLEKEYITYPQFRDIQELRLTSEKTREILKRISSNGVTGYETFKQLLARSKQQALVKHLKEQEGILKKELEGQKQKRQMASANKKGKMQPPVHQIAAELANVPKEKDLLKIAEAIGRNWEMLAPYLITKNPTATVEQIQMDKHSTRMRIYELLIKWKQEAADKATFGELFHQMLQVGTSVTIEWGDIAKSLSIAEKDIRACKEFYVSPVSGSGKPVQQPHDNNPKKMEVVPSGTEGQGQGTLPINDKSHTETDGPLSKSKQADKRYGPLKDACIFDGRLLKLEQTDIDMLENGCKTEIGSGAFGKVYRSESVLEEYGITVALKKTSIGKNPAQDRSVNREKIASRMMHPFILPLLAVVERPNGKAKVWFVSPFCENGDLLSAIKDDRDAITQNKEIKMNNGTRLKILIQIASAIQYIHTEVPGVRMQILHKDISSKNVVLDSNFNARLIDFGLAREKDDLTTDIHGRFNYWHPGVGRSNASESWDYFAFGVVIREMLTGLGPQGIKGFKILKYFTSEEIKKEFQKNVWIEEGPVPERSRKLNSIAEKCVAENIDWTVSLFKDEVVEKMNGIWKNCNRSKLFDIKDCDDKQCHICIINPIARESSMKQHCVANCRQMIKVCIACEKNSFLNPITCYCGAKLEPSIGSKWGALLVAGNDVEEKSLAKALTKDLTELKKVITSKAPRIMGISEKKVRIVVPDKPGKPKDGGKPEELWPKVKEEIQHFSKEKDIDTLLVYFSCHGAKGNGTGDQNGKNRFELASVSDCITLEDFQKELEKLKNIDTLIIFLDRCFPPLLHLKNITNVIQINACREDQMADFNDKGSTFTKYLIQGLKAKSEEKLCRGNCNHCNAYWGKRDFISAHSLFTYVLNHMKEDEAATPRFQQMLSDCKYIAYYTDEVVKIDFTSKDSKTDVTLEYLQDMDQLKDKLIKKFRRKTKEAMWCILCGDFCPEAENVTVSIQKDTYRKDAQFINCDSLEQVMSAWVHRQPLHVTFGDSSNQA